MIGETATGRTRAGEAVEPDEPGEREESLKEEDGEDERAMIDSILREFTRDEEPKRASRAWGGSECSHG